VQFDEDLVIFCYVLAPINRFVKWTSKVWACSSWIKRRSTLTPPRTGWSVRDSWRSISCQSARWSCRPFESPEWR